MDKKALLFAVLALIATSALPAAPAYAQATRTWVSGVGDDVNPCSRTAPCKTFAGAISKTAAGGEINCLDPGGFGAVTITKSITIDCSGTFGSVLVAGTNGIIVNAAATDRVVLRGLSIQGAGTGINGIRFLAGAQLSVEQCIIAGFTTNGIDINTTSVADVYVTNTYITKADKGIRVQTSAANVIVEVNQVTLANLTTHGFEGATGLVIGTLTNVVIASAGGSGVIGSGGSAQINVDTSTLVNNNIAFNTSVSGAVIRVSNNNIYNNGTNFNIAAGGTIETANNNRTTAGGATNPNGTIVLR